MKGDDWPIVGYVDRFSVPPGGTLDVMVSTDRDQFTASVVRLGGSQPEPIDLTGERTYAGRVQPIFAGSYVAVPHSPMFDRVEVLGVQAWIYPTMLDAGVAQGLLTKWSEDRDSGWGLYLDETGCLMFAVGTGGRASVRYASSKQLRVRNWYHVACSYDCRSGVARLTHEALSPWPEAEHADQTESSLGVDRLPVNVAPLLIGAGCWQEALPPHAGQLFDGKIENPSVFSAKTLLASWDFSIGISSTVITDISPNRLHGATVNMPMRAATGHLWRASEQRFADAPDEYAAIHFHRDDLENAGWERDVRLQIPTELPSGAYAVHLAAGTDVDDVPFFVVAKPKSRAQILFLAPTLTYLAYANEHFWSGTGTLPDVSSGPDPADLFVANHPEVGRGLYDRHSDGSGCCYSSRLRPLLNMRPDYRYFRSGGARNFSADLLFLQWLERKGFSYDVVTDEELNVVGARALQSYQVVITGSHPEYSTAAMLEALHLYVESGGRLMYLGGNGFYWVSTVTPENPHVIEVRRGVAGTRTWSSEPGELYHSTTGEIGGLWRHRGRPANQLVGVGFAAMGDGGSGYRRLEGSFGKEVSFVFRGVREDEVIGDFGAAGDEVDRADAALGSPPNAVLLASATDLNESYQAASEDQVVEARDEARIHGKRADMVYFERANGGAVFSVGSINWFVSIGFNDDQNNVSRITENVLRHFLRQV